MRPEVPVAESAIAAISANGRLDANFVGLLVATTLRQEERVTTDTGRRNTGTTQIYRTHYHGPDSGRG